MQVKKKYFLKMGKKNFEWKKVLICKEKREGKGVSLSRIIELNIFLLPYKNLSRFFFNQN